MTNQNERSFEQQQPKTTDTADQSKKHPSHESGQPQPKEQDPSKKNPSQIDDPRPRDGEGSEQDEKRRAS